MDVGRGARLSEARQISGDAARRASATLLIFARHRSTVMTSTWPITYDEISPFYTRVEKMIGVASTVQNRPSNPDGSYLPPFKFRCLDFILEAGCNKLGVPYLPDRCAQLTPAADEGHPACHFCGECTTGCDVGAFFSTPYFLLPKAEATKNLELRTDALAKNVLVDENGHATGVAYIDRKTKQEVEVYGRAVVVAVHRASSQRTSC